MKQEQNSTNTGSDGSDTRLPRGRGNNPNGNNDNPDELSLVGAARMSLPSPAVLPLSDCRLTREQLLNIIQKTLELVDEDDFDDDAPRKTMAATTSPLKRKRGSGNEGQ